MANEESTPSNLVLLSIKNDYLNTDQVMELLGVSRQTIHNWTCAKKLPYYKFGKTLRFHIRDIQAYIETTRQEAIS
ncbi:MAG: helix-turn-helix domain-containing protein [Spirochaetia bacterium]|nr:helix-turn-helix domain-containing protein [Spirochaetia bacterium]